MPTQMGWKLKIRKVPMVVKCFLLSTQLLTAQHQHKPRHIVSCRAQTLTFAASDHRNVAGARAAIKNDGFLYPGDEEVGTFSYHRVLDPTEPVKDDSSVTRINWRQKQHVKHGFTIAIRCTCAPPKPSLWKWSVGGS